MFCIYICCGTLRLNLRYLLLIHLLFTVQRYTFRYTLPPRHKNLHTTHLYSHLPCASWYIVCICLHFADPQLCLNLVICCDTLYGTVLLHYAFHTRCYAAIRRLHLSTTFVTIITHLFTLILLTVTAPNLFRVYLDHAFVTDHFHTTTHFILLLHVCSLLRIRRYIYVTLCTFLIFHFTFVD